MTYQQWAFIADVYTPMIALACFISILRVMMKGNVQQGFIRLGLVVLSTLFIYGVMFLDNVLHIWPAFGLDYRTHTAIALVFVADILTTSVFILPALLLIQSHKFTKC
ncbi:hypothetical protein ACP5PY_08125 [Photobacterium leiognathi subsp. mandapamensis]